MRSFHKTSISRMRLFLLCTVVILSGSVTYQLLLGNSITNAGLASVQSAPMTTQTLTVPANNFSVISGSISGLADDSINANIARVRAAMTAPVPGVVSASYIFKILGNSPTVVPDSDGVTRQGVVFWVNMQNACNLDFLFWRTDSTQPAGTTMVGAKVQVNPSITSQTVNNSDLIACAGVGYSTLSQPDGTSAETSSNVDIMDGNWHNFTIVRLGPERWQLYTDNIFVFEAYDPANNFPVDSNLWGLRLDNVQIQLYYQLTINTAQQFSTSFTITPPKGLLGQSISFSASATGGSQPYTYSWDFGDGAGGTGSSVSHTYSAAGTYTVVLTVKDNGSPQQSVTFQHLVSVNSPPPALTSSFSHSPSSPEVGQLVTLSGSVSGGTTPYSFSWNFGDSSAGTGSTVTHTYSSPGTFTVILTVKDSGSPQQTSTSQQPLTVVNPPPQFTASLGYSPTNPGAGQTVSFTGFASGGTSPYTFSWNFGDGSRGTGSTATHSYSAAGTFTVVLTARESSSTQQTSSAQQTITVTSPPPSPLGANFSFNPSSPQAAQTVTFTASTSGGTGPYSFSWDLGDGATSTGAYTSHLYNLSGTYTVQLIVTDNTGQSDSTSQTITVIGSQVRPLIANFNYKPSPTTVGTTITLTAATSGGTAPYTHNWNLGDGSTASGTSIGHLYTKAGNYTVTLTTTDFRGETTTSSKTLSISNGPTAQSQPPAQPPSSPSSGGTCILCDTSRFVSTLSTLSLLTIGLFAGGFLSVGIFLSKYHGENRRLAAELRSHYQLKRTTPSLQVKPTRTARRRTSREYRTF